MNYENIGHHLEKFTMSKCVEKKIKIKLKKCYLITRFKNNLNLQAVIQ